MVFNIGSYIVSVGAYRMLIKFISDPELEGLIVIIDLIHRVGELERDRGKGQALKDQVHPKFI